MKGKGQVTDRLRVEDSAIHDDGVDILVGESFIDYPWDEVTHDKAREPLVANGSPHFERISGSVFSDLAWYVDPLRQDPIPEYGPEAIAKMRQPLLSFRHYRVSPGTLRLLSDLSWS